MPISAAKRIEKAPGWDWIVYYLDGDDPEIQLMTVFGQMKPENAIQEARYSLSFSDNTDFEIVGLVRADKKFWTRR